MPEISSADALPRRARSFSFDSAASWTLIGASILAAIAFIPVAVIPFLYTKVSILAIGGLITLALYILARLTRGNLVVPPLALIGGMWLIPLAYVLSALFSGVGIHAAFFGTDIETDTLGFVLLLTAFATLTALTLRRSGHYRAFFTSGVVLFMIVLVSQVLFVLIGHSSPNTVSPTANLIGSFSDLGMIVGLGAALTMLALRFLTLSNRTRIVLMVCGVVALALLALVNSALIWALVALVALGLFIEAILRRRTISDDSDLEGVSMILADTDGETRGTEAHSLVAPLIVLVVALFFLIGGGTIGNALVSAFGANVIDVRPSWQSTFAVGSHTYASSPLFGSGPGTFGEQWLKFRDRSLNDTLFWNVDFTSGIGYIPTSFVTTGLMGALAWVVFLGLFLFIGLRALLLRLSGDPFIRFVSVASFTGALYVFALAVFAVPGPIVLLVGFLLAGVFISSLRYSGTRHEWGVVFARNPRIGFVIVFGLTLLLLASILAAYVLVERYLADVAYAEASVALSAGNLDAADKDIARSILFSQSDRAYQLAAAIGIAHMTQIASNTKLAPTDAQTQFQAALSTSISSALTATRLGPNNYQNWAMLGNVYETVVPLNIQGAYDNAKSAYQKAITLNPSNPTLPYILAQLEIAQKNNAAAEQDLITSINLKHDYTQAIFLLSQLEVQEGKAKEALQAAEAAAYFAPTDPTVLFQVGILRSANGDTDGAIAALSSAVQANPQYANAHFFLAVMYAIKGVNDKALAELNAVAVLSPQNAQAVQADIDSLKAGKNPFPPSRLGALGIPQTPVSDARTAPPVSNATAPSTPTAPQKTGQ